jgi:hypothetical protein
VQYPFDSDEVRYSVICLLCGCKASEVGVLFRTENRRLRGKQKRAAQLIIPFRHAASLLLAACINPYMKFLLLLLMTNNSAQCRNGKAVYPLTIALIGSMLKTWNDSFGCLCVKLVVAK